MSLYRFVIQQYDTLPPPVQEIVFALGWVVVSAGAVVLALIAATYLFPVLDRIWPMPEIQTHPEVLNDEKRSPDGDGRRLEVGQAESGSLLHADGSEPSASHSFRRQRDPLLWRDHARADLQRSLRQMQRGR